jgi:hypothetical protein
MLSQRDEKAIVVPVRWARTAYQHNPRNLLERMRDHDPTGEIHSTPTGKPDSLIQISQRRTLHSGGPPRTTRKHPLRHRNHRDRIRRSALIGQPRP